MTLLLAICMFTADGRICNGTAIKMPDYAACRDAAAAIRRHMPDTHKVIWHECKREK